uniref:Zgc:85932 n=1 Tax=Oryzias latipes TaxID=8090 RepID=A0A3P9HKU2_ORYLA
MRRSRTSSSGSSIPPLDEDVTPMEEEDGNELLGSQSRRWLADLLSGDLAAPAADGVTLGRDGLFVDYQFPVGELEMQAGLKWKRPKELCSSPQFIIDGASRLDIVQGKLSDCWLLAAIASLAMHRSLLKKVVPLHQSFEEDYNGSFVFRFWQYGQWEEVRIDDLLPTENDKLVYLSSPERREFWSSLLEKAYAKLKGGYRALDMGFPHEAMVDMTGGVTEVFSIASLPRNLLEFLDYLLSKGALINCANSHGVTETMNDLGILFRHAYALTAVEKVKTTNGPVDLVRILNPWGRTEWKGPWSDLGSPEWQTVSLEEQRRLDRVSREDGEFWMSISDFRQNFEVMEVCHLTECLGEPGSSVLPWSCVMHHGNWVPRITAGGGPHHSLFWQNPQFLLVLSEVDSKPRHAQKTCSFVLALMQKHQRRRGISLSIGMHVYLTRAQTPYLTPDELRMLQPVLLIQHSSRREVVLRGSLPPGRYIIVPSTLEPNQEGAFLLRVLTERGNAATLARNPAPDVSLSLTEPSVPHQSALPSVQAVGQLFKKHSNKRGFCKPLHLLNLLTEAIQGGVLAGSEKYLSLEHCKSLVVLMDRQGIAQLNWPEFQCLWDKIRRWTDIFLMFDKNKTKHLEYQEVKPALMEAGIKVDDLVMQLVGLRYTEPDMTVSFPGFLYLMMKMESMIHKFQSYDMMGMGTVNISFRQWLYITMYN